MHNLLEHYHALQDLFNQGTACIEATLVDITGSAPQNVGAKVIVTEAGLHRGTIGGGKIEARVIQEAQNLLKETQNHCYREWNLQTDIGMTCGGVVRIYFEVLRPNGWSIAVFGAGHVAQALIPLLTTLPCQIRCYDPRSEWIASLPQHPHLQAEVVAQPFEKVADLPLGSFLLSLTMGHAHDTPILAAALERQRIKPDAFAFLGVIGSPAKAGVLKRELTQKGISEELLDQLHCPIGLPLGSNEPSEIAISITAQLLQERDRWQKTAKWQKPGYLRREKRVLEASDQAD
jgi:xanthine dehydrogenase accessory factor